MKVGLYNLEPKVENTAMMQVSQYHKERGDKVELYSPFEEYDKVYAFSIFDFTKKHYIKNGMICGGTGFNVVRQLPPEIARCGLDYSIFPKCKTSYIWFSRGCVRNCPWCVIPRKEGTIHAVEPKNLNPNGEYITVMDNNLVASPNYYQTLETLKDWGQPVDIEQGLDIRLMKDHWGEILELKHQKQIHTAWDNPKEDLTYYYFHALQNVSASKLMAYVLIGYNSTEAEDLMRVQFFKEHKIDPFVMPFNKYDPYQRRFARWVNHKATFKTVEWEDYEA